MKKGIIKIILSGSLMLTSFFGLAGFSYSNMRDNVDSNFQLKGEEKVTVSYGEKYNDDGYILNLDEDDVTTTNNVDTSKLGTYDLTYTVNYKNYTKTIKREVNVVDNEAPTITTECNDELYSEVNKELQNCNYTVTDNYDKQNKIKTEVKSNVDTTKIGDYTITIKATDSSNNTRTKQIKVHIKRKNELNYIEVFISKQRLDYYENGKLYLTTPITSGAYNRTPKGSFKVFNKARNTYLRSGTYNTFVKYWIGFKGYRYGIHDASWRNNFGNKNYYVNGSHGCINTPTDKVKELYDRVYVGMPVYIKD